MQNNYFIEKIGDAYVTSKFWTCSCKEFPLHSEHEAKCPHCGVDQKEAAPANVALVMKHAEELKGVDDAALMAVYNSILSADNTGPDDVYRADIIHSLAEHHGYSDEADTGILHRVIIQDVVNELTKMLDNHEVGMGMLTGDKFPDLLQYIENDLWFDVEQAVRCAIRGWLEVEKQNARKAEEAKRQLFEAEVN